MNLAIALPLASALAALPLFLGVALATFLLLRRLARRRRAEQTIEGNSAKRTATAVASSPLHRPAEFLQIQVELQELHRELSARLDTKMSALMHLIRQTDERIAQLQELSSQVAREHSPTVAASAPQPPTTSFNAADTLIHELATQGLSAATIAHRVSQPIAEVEATLQRGSAAGLRPRAVNER